MNGSLIDGNYYRQLLSAIIVGNYRTLVLGSIVCGLIP